MKQSTSRSFNMEIFLNTKLICDYILSGGIVKKKNVTWLLQSILKIVDFKQSIALASRAVPHSYEHFFYFSIAHKVSLSISPIVLPSGPLAEEPAACAFRVWTLHRRAG